MRQWWSLLMPLLLYRIHIVPRAQEEISIWLFLVANFMRAVIESAFWQAWKMRHNKIDKFSKSHTAISKTTTEDSKLRTFRWLHKPPRSGPCSRVRIWYSVVLWKLLNQVSICAGGWSTWSEFANCTSQQEEKYFQVIVLIESEEIVLSFWE